jgi:hypothetical protein
MVSMEHQEVASAEGEVDGIGSGLCPGELNWLRTMSNKGWLIFRLQIQICRITATVVGKQPHERSSRICLCAINYWCS